MESMAEYKTCRKTEKRGNETGSITQTGQLDIKRNENRGCVLPLRVKKKTQSDLQWRRTLIFLVQVLISLSAQDVSKHVTVLFK